MSPESKSALRLSFVTAVWETNPKFLRECCHSIYSQKSDFEGQIEHVLVDDCSESKKTQAELKSLKKKGFYKIDRLENHGGIVAATRKALTLASGEYVAFIDHDDMISPGALKTIFEYFEKYPDADMFYSDEARLSLEGKVVDHFLKPSWSPERLRSQNYCSHLTIIKKSLIESVGGIRDGFDGSQDYDLFLRASEKANQVIHIPEILYLWRVVVGSVSDEGVNGNSLPYENAKKALKEHGERLGFKDVEVEQLASSGVYQLKRTYPKKAKISVIVPTAFREKSYQGVKEIMALHALLSLTTVVSPDYELEIIITTNIDVAQDIQQRFYELFPSAIFHINPSPFNFSRQVNEAAVKASGDFILLLNDDTELIKEDSLERMLSYFSESDVGIVGAKLLYPDSRIQHAGVLYYENGPYHFLRGYHSTDTHYSDSLFCSRESSAVTFAVALMTREVFERVGGLCEDLVNNFNDVDCCAKARHLGYRIIFAADAVFFHFESETRGIEVKQEEIDCMRKRWSVALNNDPYVNPHLIYSMDRFSVKS